MKYASVLSRTLTDADAVTILGATLFYLREKHPVCTVADCEANLAAQSTVTTLREIAFTLAYEVNQ